MVKYFNSIELADFEELLYNSEKIYAHLTEDGRKETLKEHSKLCISYMEKIITNKQLDNVLIRLEDNLLFNMSDEGINLYKEMLYHTIYLHDIGKINCNYQYQKMKNIFFKEKYSIDCNNSNHSMLSAIIYINEFNEKIAHIKNKRECPRLGIFMLLNAYVISKHHGKFDKFENFIGKLLDPDGEGRCLLMEQEILYKGVYQKTISFSRGDSLKKIINFVKKTISEMEQNHRESSIDLYIYERFLASILLACDYYATTEFKNQTVINHFGEIDNISEFYNIYKKTPIYQAIQTYKQNDYGKNHNYSKLKNINILRNELFLDAEDVLISNPDSDIYFLEAPTGSGKSMVSFNLAFKVIEKSESLNKIFYVYPFNTLIEQNMDTLSKIFGRSKQMKDIAIINSLVPIKKIDKFYNEDGDVINAAHIDYVRSLLDRQFLHYPLVLTTHVSMFRYLFGTDKEALFPLAQIANSVIIFDEIQSYRNEIWKEIIIFLSHYAKLLNIKVLIMSATLPDLSKLTDTDTKVVNLIKDRNKYFQNPVFKDRVELDFSLLDLKHDIVEHLIEHVIKSAKEDNINILMEFIYRSSAYEVYERLCNEEVSRKEIMLLTGDDSSHERKKIVEAFKCRKNIILVATQVIEAGIDLDANIGYKDISLLDSEEQFIGRINRNFSNKEKKGIVYFFDMDSAGMIYKNDVRKEKTYTLKNEKIKEILRNKDFSTFYDEVLNHLSKHAYEFYDFLKGEISTLDFQSIEDRMSLIDSQYKYSVFLSRTIYISNTETLEGEKVWNDYIKLLEDTELDYAEKKVKISEAAAKLSYFIYKTNNTDFKYEKHIGDLYYISDGDQYFENGKFIRKNFENDLFD